MKSPFLEEAARKSQRRTFDAIAADYDAHRPAYPPELFEDVISLSGLPSGGRILEIGPGTGQASRPFAKRGYEIDAYELGADLAAIWRQRLSSFPNASITVQEFEKAALENERYDLAIAASSFHWIDPLNGFAKVARALKPGGSMALWWNRPVSNGTDTDFADRSRAIFEQFAPEIAQRQSGFPDAESLEHPTGLQLGESEYFGPATTRKYQWTLVLDAVSFTSYLGTFSRIQDLDPVNRDCLFHELESVIDTEFDGVVTRGMVTLFYIAKRA